MKYLIQNNYIILKNQKHFFKFYLQKAQFFYLSIK